MKKLILIISFSCVAIGVNAQTKIKSPEADTVIYKTQIVEAACGECKLGMKVPGCQLAVRINGKAYLVEGADLDDYGDAHATHGMCNAIRKAEVTGKIEHDKFVATSFKLLPVEAVKNK